MLGVPEIEQQHQELLNLVNELNDAVKNKEPREEIYRRIDKVIAYTYFHFSTEERLMALSGYPGTETHKEMHEQLIQDALRLKKKLDHVGELLFLEWFNHWPFSRILAHIQYADKPFEEHIMQTGLKE